MSQVKTIELHNPVIAPRKENMCTRFSYEFVNAIEEKKDVYFLLSPDTYSNKTFVAAPLIQTNSKGHLYITAFTDRRAMETYAEDHQIPMLSGAYPAASMPKDRKALIAFLFGLLFNYVTKILTPEKNNPENDLLDILYLIQLLGEGTKLDSSMLFQKIGLMPVAGRENAAREALRTKRRKKG